MQLTKRLSPATWTYWRIVLTLAGKDVIEALKNKTTLTMMLGLAMMMLTVEALPLLLKLDQRPQVAIYDDARSGVADELRRDGAVRVLEMRTADDAIATAREAAGPLVAVALPADWESGAGTLQITGYVAHWTPPQAAQELIAQAEAVLTAVTHRPITILPQTVYPSLDNGGRAAMVSLGLVLAATLLTTILVPYLILDEKTGHTLDALRVSPANLTQVLLGKGLAGAVYGILAIAVLLAFNMSMVAQWGLFLLAALSIILFGVGLGLTVGTLVENEGMVQMWGGLLSILLMFPLMLAFVNSNRLPDWVTGTLAWLPTTAAFDLMRLSFGNLWSSAIIGPKLLTLALSVVLVFSVASWRLRAWDV